RPPAARRGQAHRVRARRARAALRARGRAHARSQPQHRLLEAAARAARLRARGPRAGEAMTHELGPEARALLDAAREGLGPDAAAIRRMRAGIDASIAGGAAGAGAAGGGAAGAGAL